MANTLITKNSSTAAAIPTAGDLVQGELAVNVTDKRVFTENAAGAVVELGVNPSSLTLTSGTANGVPYLNGSKVLTSGSALTFDGSTLTTTAGIEGTKLTTAGNISLYNSSSSQLTHYQQLSSSYTASYIQSALSGSSSSLVFAVNSNWTNSNASEQMRLTSTGLGIGTSSPTNKLDVVGDVGLNNNNALKFKNSAGTYQPVVQWATGDNIHIGDVSNSTNSILKLFAGSGNGQTLFYGNNIERMRINSAGNVGIGTGSPSRRLSLDGGAGTQTWTGYQQAGTEKFVVGLDASGNPSLIGTQSAPMILYTNNAERVRIDSSGNLLVGTTAQSNQPSQGVQCVGSASGQVSVGHGGGVGTGSYFMSFAHNAGIIGTITQNGTTSVLYNTTSDYRLKDNQQPLTGSGVFIDALKPTTWEWTADGRTDAGFIAHEFQEVAPNSVTGVKDELNEDGTPKYQAMQASSAEVIANLVAEIQSLRQRLAAAGI